MTQTITFIISKRLTFYHYYYFNTGLWNCSAMYGCFLQTHHFLILMIDSNRCFYKDRSRWVKTEPENCFAFQLLTDYVSAHRYFGRFSTRCPSGLNTLLHTCRQQQLWGNTTLWWICTTTSGWCSKYYRHRLITIMSRVPVVVYYHFYTIQNLLKLLHH